MSVHTLPVGSVRRMTSFFAERCPTRLGASFGPVIKDGEWWRLREQASRALAVGLLLHDYKLISDLAALLDTDGRCLYDSPS